jgi:hypothetical protein
MPNRQPRTITVLDLFGAPQRRRTAAVRRQRRVLAQRMHAELAGPPPRIPGHCLLAACTVAVAETGWSPKLRAAMDRAPGDAHVNPHKLLVAPGYRPRTVATTTPPGGAVRLHGEDYSLVFGYLIDPRPRPTAPVLVLLDTMPDWAIRIDNDPDLPTRILVIGMAFQVLQAARAARPEAFTDPVTAGVTTTA